MVVDGDVKPMRLHVTNKTFAQKLNPDTYYVQKFKAYYCGEIA